MSLFARLGVTARRDPKLPVTLEPFPEVCVNGVVRASVLVLVVDMMAGFIAEESCEGDWTFTTDLSLRAPAQHVPERVESQGTLLRGGRGSVSAGVSMRAGAEDFAYGIAGFIRLPRRHGDPPKPHLHEDAELLRLPPIERPLADEVGIQVKDASRGEVEVELVDALRNPAGALQGAMAALVAEVAAEALAEDARQRPQVVTDFDIRYLAMGREGPIYSSASWVAGPESGAMRVELRDRGNRDRLIISALARSSDAPG